MFPLLGLLVLAYAVAPKDRLRKVGLGDMPELPSGDAERLPTSSGTVYLVEKAMYVHPAQRAAAAARADESDSRWLVVPSSGWAGSKPFATARQARTVLRAAGFKGPYGHGQSSRWVR